MESLVSSVTFLRDFIVDKTSCQCPPFAHQRGQELNSSFSCEHNEETLTWYPCTLADKWGSRNFPKYQCPYFHADTDMAAPCCMVLYPFTSVHFTSYLFWGSPHFYLPFWALGSMVAFAAGPCKQSHLHRNWWSLPTNSSLKKTHHILPSFGGAVKSKTLPCTNCDEQPKFEEFECKQATCHCCKEAVDAFPCCRFHVFSLLDFRKVYMQSSTVYRSRKLGSLSSVIKINI